MAAGARFTYGGVERFPDGRLFNQTCLRNSPPMVARLAVLLEGRTGPVLEIGAGTGQHAAAFALAFPALDWWPSDPEPPHRASIAAWAAFLRAPAHPALDIDAGSDWAAHQDVARLGPLTAVVAMNVLHISPWSVSEGIFHGAGRALGPGGLLLIYGPFHEDGAPTGPGNAAFDADLKARNPDWGIRDIADLNTCARKAGLSPERPCPMPADNRLLVFRKP